MPSCRFHSVCLEPLGLLTGCASWLLVHRVSSCIGVVLRLDVFISWGFNLTSCQIGLAITSCVHRGGSELVGLFEGKGVAEFG